LQTGAADSNPLIVLIERRMRGLESPPPVANSEGYSWEKEKNNFIAVIGAAADLLGAADSDPLIKID
jgi:hypothetical protein